MKICTKCNNEKEYLLFSKDSTKKDGLSSWCKLCQSNNHKIYREENKKEIATKKKLHYELNKEKVAKRGAEYYRENRDSCLARNKDWALRNKESCDKQKLAWRMANPEYAKMLRRSQIKVLNDQYIKKLIGQYTGISYKDIPQSLIDLQKAHIQLKRELKSMEQQT